MWGLISQQQNIKTAEWKDGLLSIKKNLIYTPKLPKPNPFYSWQLKHDLGLGNYPI